MTRYTYRKSSVGPKVDDAALESKISWIMEQPVWDRVDNPHGAYRLSCPRCGFTLDVHHRHRERLKRLVMLPCMCCLKSSRRPGATRVVVERMVRKNWNAVP